ncbi:Protein N-acetyltransferase, RimJ/RimL family [Microbulbifer donghaiensis]|uniref:Protein N-acetyltransferase, RimJ/RimL family n=1 Tax=Microbulbifer donghaiensis TaxID=494016 RepID=A0A1M5HSU4_9GAMM|nr:GNAT family N-acetyltransferase [Microbulbifer donghaiensis]SHG19000.1 Protein N-acetyltransferase, RimJ/RimL family [Microbulbifer donghaiensis]
MNQQINSAPPSTILETQRLWLREFTLDDIEDYYLLNANPEVVRFVGRKPLTSRDQALQLLQAGPLRDYRERGMGRLACIAKDSGRLIGFAGVKYVAEIDEVDIGYRFLPEYWGRGLASESATAVMAYGRTVLGLQRIVGIVDPANEGSASVLRKLGLQYERTIALSLSEADLHLYA